MKIAPELLIEKLRSGETLPSVLGAVGEEEYYRSRIAHLLEEYVFHATDETDRAITVLEKNAGLAELENAVNSYPFFSGRSLVILREGKLTAGNQESGRALAALLSDVPEYCTVLVDVPKLDGRGHLYRYLRDDALLCECASLKPSALGPWLSRRAAELGGRLDAGAQAAISEYLAAVDKAPLLLLSRELEKIALYAGTRTLWTQKDVEAVFSSLPEVSGFALVNAVAAHQLTETLRLLAVERGRRGGSFMLLLGQLGYQLRRLLRLRELLRQGADKAQIIAALKLHPYVASRLLAQSRRFSENRLKEALLSLARLNIEVRRGGRQYRRLEEILIVLLS